MPDRSPRRRRLTRVIVIALVSTAVLSSAWLVRRYMASAGAPSLGLRTYTAPRLAGDGPRSAIRLDGDPSEPAWAAAPIAGPFVLSSGKAAAPLRCIARLVWDHDALYVAFEAEDRDVMGSHRGRDEPLWARDVFEVFLDPDGDGLFYYEIQTNPRAALFDALFPAHRRDIEGSKRWNAPLLAAAVAVRGAPDDGEPDEGWSAEIRIPFSEIRHAPRSPPVPGDVWRMNLFRIDVHAEGADYTAWTPPIAGDFHTLDRFGYLVFGDAPDRPARGFDRSGRR